jgi:hypothetical protein
MWQSYTRWTPKTQLYEDILVFPTISGRKIRVPNSWPSASLRTVLLDCLVYSASSLATTTVELIYIVIYV